jgi:succinate dehydrogenase/fumarate reductase iron-sulfur protein
MSQERWNITILIARQKTNGVRHDQPFAIEVDPQEYVLDVIERIWAFKDRSLTFRHACHHSTCGACGMLVNGVEKLTCITSIQSVTHPGGTLHIAPLRNFPVVSDLVVDMSHFYLHMEQARSNQVVPLEQSALPYEKDLFAVDGLEHERLADCIECGLCISACPIAITAGSYLGPAVMAAAQLGHVQRNEVALLNLVDCADGVWRCHSGFECSAVCPSNVDPAWRIMDMRKRVIRHRLRQIFGLEPTSHSRSPKGSAS